MKKHFVVTLILALLLIGRISCQSLTIGIKGGPSNYGLLYSKFSLPTKHKIGGFFGITLLKSYSDHIDFCAELLYEQKGYIDHIKFIDQYDSWIGTDKVVFKFDYLVLPCYFHFHTSKNTKLFLDLGLYPAYLVSAIADFPVFDSNGKGITRQKTKMDTPLLSHFEIGGLIGGGVQFKITNKTLMDLNLRYNNDFISLFDKDMFNQYMFLNSLNFTLGLHYKIR